jgi:hypothetical protein
LLPSEEAANAWPKKPNDAILFNGRSALEKMLSGNVADLADVRCYLGPIDDHGLVSPK